MWTPTSRLAFPTRVLAGPQGPTVPPAQPSFAISLALLQYRQLPTGSATNRRRRALHCGNSHSDWELGILHPNGSGTLSIDYFFGTYDGQSLVHYHQNVIDYIGAGNAPFVEFTGNMDPNNEPEAFVTGYLENCALTGCPPIQH
jgi:hypothetical protein